MTIKAVFFDLFETLVTEFSGGERIAKPSYDFLEWLGIPNDEFKQEWSLRVQDRMMGRFEDYPSVLRDILAKRGLPIDEEKIEILHRQRVEEKAIPFKRIDPRIPDMLAHLKTRGIKLGLISNASAEEVVHWHDSELAPFFDDVLFSYEAGFAKPDERLFRLACERLNVDPAEALFVGDGGSDELAGAYRTGLHPVHAVWFHSRMDSPFEKVADPLMIMNMI
jgi:putative hydrolase of the HAD superfamily